jgi:beta-xylosidase
MVAVPTYLLASTAISSLGPFSLPNSVIRSPATTTVEHAASPTVSFTPDDQNDFTSVLGPVVTDNFPDPAIIYHDGVSYAFATNNRGIGPYGMIHVQIATSTDNQTWTVMEGVDALPSLGIWETGAGVWAPDVVELDDGSFVMYYADSTTFAPQHHCVGVATSTSITGPYTPLDQPFACPDVNALGGAIDPDGFLDESTGRRYVTYKVDGNSLGHGGACMNSVAPIVPTPILLQEVDTDGITLIGEAVEILDRDNFDGPLIEAPSLHLSDEGIYFLFFSSNCFTTPLYDTSYATATNITGPYTKSGRPLLVTGDGPNLLGPGGMDIIKGGNMILFHGHLTNSNIQGNLAEVQKSSGKKNRGKLGTMLVRGMYSGTATFSGTSVSLSGPIPGAT